MEGTEKKGTPDGVSLTIEESVDDIKGRITLRGDVVATVAGLAAREVPGIHSLGRSRLIPFGDDPTHGVAAEVGKRQAAFDLDVVIEYGVDIREVASEVRRRIAQQVDMMAGREVVEVNINVVDIKLPETKEEKKKPAPKPSRVH